MNGICKWYTFSINQFIFCKRKSLGGAGGGGWRGIGGELLKGLFFPALVMMLTKH